MSEADQTRRVLLVEDSEADAALATHYLCRMDPAQRPQVVYVNTLELAIARLGSETYDCVLLDLGLPDGQGVENVQRIRAAAPEVAIIVLTGQDDNHLAIAALRCGAQEYLVKGKYENGALLRVLRHAVERHSLLVALNRQRERDSFLAGHDPLTSLINRQLLAERAHETLAQAERRGESFALCFLDLDGFKPVNDSFGHAVGDAVLKEVATALASAARSSDTVARVGGDEFVVLLFPVSGIAEAEQAAQRLVQRIGSIRTVHGHAVSVGVSAGLAIYPHHGTTLEQLFLKADHAMYSAKSGERGSLKVHVDAAGPSGGASLEVDDSNLALLFQPWLDQPSGTFGGVEALLRQRLGGDLVPPDRVLRGALEFGLLGELSQWVLRSACQQWRKWRESGLPIGRLALNVSRAELSRHDFPSSTLAILESSGVPAQQLQLEVAEEAFDTATAEAIENIRVLRAHGVRVLMDTFGHGAAALKHLLTMPIDGLKLDRSLVQGLRSGKTTDRALVAAIVGVAAARQLELIAAGVEEKAEYEECLRLGCRYFQGNLLTPPLTAGQLTDLFIAKNPRRGLELIRGGRA
jgi:diguanylate cyclase